MATTSITDQVIADVEASGSQEAAQETSQAQATPAAPTAPTPKPGAESQPAAQEEASAAPEATAEEAKPQSLVDWSSLNADLEKHNVSPEQLRGILDRVNYLSTPEGEREYGRLALFGQHGTELRKEYLQQVINDPRSGERLYQVLHDRYGKPSAAQDQDQGFDDDPQVRRLQEVERRVDAKLADLKRLTEDTASTATGTAQELANQRQLRLHADEIGRFFKDHKGSAEFQQEIVDEVADLIAANPERYRQRGAATEAALKSYQRFVRARSRFGAPTPAKKQPAPPVPASSGGAAPAAASLAGKSPDQIADEAIAYLDARE